MKSIRTIFCAIVMMVVFCNCTDSAEPSFVYDTFSVDSDHLDFDYKQQSGTLTLTCSKALRNVRSMASWCTVEVGPKKGNTVTITVSVESNDTKQLRQTTVMLVGEDKTVIVNVSQYYKEMDIVLSESEFSVPCYGLYDGSFTVTSSEQPEISSDSKWISMVCANISSDNTTAVTLYVGANRSTSERVGEITVKSGTRISTIKVRQKGFAVEKTDASAITPDIVYDAMQPGWNLGNQMDGYSNDVACETAWGNRKCTQATMDAVAKAGFKSVRIPVTWMGHIGEGPVYKIEDAWMDRVAEIVLYAHNAGLTAIVNTHHDENNNESEAHWLDIKSAYKDNERNEAIKDEIFCVWSQIATRFKDEGEWLIYEPFNEIQDGGWGWSSEFRAKPSAQYKVLNEWNQVFVNAVRATGSVNATRWLSTVGYAQSSSCTIPGLVLPSDYTGGNRLVVAFHDYDPYNFTLADPLKEQWGHTADPAKRCSDTDEQNVVNTFDQFVKAYLDKDIPLYMGEMGCSFRSGNSFAFQKYYIEYFCKAAADRGIPIIVWDNGAEGNGPECHSYFNHATGEFPSENARTVVEIIIKATSCKEPSYTLESVWNSAPVFK